MCLADLLHVGLLPTAGQHNQSADFGLLLDELLLVDLVLVVGQLVLVVDVDFQVLECNQFSIHSNFFLALDALYRKFYVETVLLWAQSVSYIRFFLASVVS